MAFTVALVVGCAGPSSWIEGTDGWRAEREHWAVAVGSTGLDISGRDRNPVHVAVSRIALGETALALDEASPGLDGMAVVRALAADVEERVEVADEGVELSWRFRARPAAGDLVVRLRVADARAVVEDADGWHFVSGDRGVRIAPATWIDDDGVRTAISAQAEGDTLSLVVPAEVIARSSFPAVLDPLIGPELPVDAPATSVLGTYSPHHPSVAFDGTNYMIAWQHQHAFPSSMFSNDIVVARVRASDGAVLDPGGIAIAQGGTGVSVGFPDIAFDGTGFLVVWDSGGDVFGKRVAIDGTVLDASPLVLSSASGFQTDVAVACAIGNCLAVWEDARAVTSTQTIGTRVDTSAGIVRDPLGLVFAGNSNDPDVASDGTNYLVAWTAGTAQRATRIRATDGAPIGTPTITVATGNFAETAIDYAAGQYIVTFRNIYTPSTAYAGRVRASDGAVLDATPATISTSTESEYGVAACAAGTDFLLAWYVDVNASSSVTDYDVRGTVMRTSDGSLAPATGVTIAGGFFDQTSPALVAGPTGQLIAVYVDDTSAVQRIAARRFDSATLTAIDATPIWISVIANEQRAPAIASDGTDFLVVWSDGRGTRTRIYGARIRADGAPIDAPAFPISDGIGSAARPAVAYGAGEYYVVWDDARTGSDLYGARVGADGTLIDATSRLLFTASGTQAAPSIAFDGTRFVATWDDSRNTPSMIAMEPSDGSVVNPFGTPLSLSTGRRVAITCNPSLCLGIWINGTQGEAARIDHGTVLDATPIALGTVFGTNVDAATDGTSFVAAYQTSGTSVALNGRRITSAGALGTATTLRSGTEMLFAIAWDGGSYDVAWSDGTDIGVVRARADASALGAFTVPALGTTTSASILSIASTGTGESLMGYDRPDYYTRTFGGWRVRVRTVLPSAAGVACAAGAECASGFCVDSVCCDTACAGGTTDCRACSVAAGAGADGVCAPITAAMHTCRASTSACDVAEVCDGIATTCPTDLFAAAGTVCRAATDVCDAVESCDGTSSGCPTDGFVPASTVCRAASDACDAAEVCSGSSRACPTDGRIASGTTCRAAAGACDVAESCDGVGAACPVDEVRPIGTVCRPAAGPCDVFETCDGASFPCPVDTFAASAIVCRTSVGACDATEVCSGFGAACPADAFVPDGMSCADTLTCNGAETCVGGACRAGSAPACGDGDACTSDYCAEPGGCAHDPISGCGAPDAAADLDAGVAAPDASMEPDAGFVEFDAFVTSLDAWVEPDGGVEGPDGDADLDAAAGTRDAAPIDASRIVDAEFDGGGSSAPPAANCSCRTTASRSPGGGSSVLTLIAIAIVGRRKRRKARVARG